MALQFLSKEWFDQVMSLRAEALATLGDDGLPADVKQVKLNISVPHADGEKQFSVRNGDAQMGHISDADTKLTLEYDVARRLVLEGDVSAGMQAFMSGQIKVEGDMSKLLVLQQHLAAQLTPAQAALRDRMIGFTAT